MPLDLKCVAALTAATVISSASSAGAQCSSAPDMNGVWKANDGGTYYVRQVANEVWWLGVGQNFANVYHGVRQGNTVVGSWADVPKGSTRGAGVLNLAITGGASVSGWRTMRMSGGFAGMSWYRPCGDVSLNPK